MSVYLALLHHPVYNKHRSVVATAVTNMDIHDLSRTSRTYGLDGVFLVTPVEQQRMLVKAIIAHWVEGGGARYNPLRKEAMDLVEVLPSLEAVVDEVGGDPLVVVTGAKLAEGITGYQEARRLMAATDRPVVLVFGTGWGLAEEVTDAAEVRLAPILGAGDYNHLPVRAAVAIILDRLLGEPWWTKTEQQAHESYE